MDHAQLRQQATVVRGNQRLPAEYNAEHGHRHAQREDGDLWHALRDPHRGTPHLRCADCHIGAPASKSPRFHVMAVAVMTGHGASGMLPLLPATATRDPDRVAVVGLHE
jgi:hypothetical protein